MWAHRGLFDPDDTGTPRTTCGCVDTGAYLSRPRQTGIYFLSTIRIFLLYSAMADMSLWISLLGLALLLVITPVVFGKECYVCSGAFPERDCEMWPDRVRHGPGKQECGSRYCTTYIRYRPMQHLLIPLGPNKPKATAAPLRPTDFEAVSISRDCVERTPGERDNRCFQDSDGLGATCFTSCSTPLCNGGLRKPNTTELRGKTAYSLPPIGPNEYEKWTPSTARPTQPPTPRTTTPTIRLIENDKMADRGDKMADRDNEPDVHKEKGGRRPRPRPGHPKRGDTSNIRGLPEDAGNGVVGVQSVCVALVTVCSVMLHLLVV